MSEDLRLKVEKMLKVEKKKKRVVRKGIKSMNMYMEYLLKDYSYMKR